MTPMEEIYQKYAMTVYRYLMSKVHNADLAEELTQETFYQAIRSSERFDGSSKVSTWLCGIARNVLFTYRRKHPVMEDILDQDLTQGSAESDALNELGKVELMRKLHDLPEPYREILYLRLFGGLSFKEIGDILQKTENYARVTFYRGKEKLKGSLKDE